MQELIGIENQFILGYYETMFHLCFIVLPLFFIMNVILYMEIKSNIDIEIEIRRSPMFFSFFITLFIFLTLPYFVISLIWVSSFALYFVTIKELSEKIVKKRELNQWKSI